MNTAKVKIVTYKTAKHYGLYFPQLLEEQSVYAHLPIEPKDTATEIEIEFYTTGNDTLDDTLDGSEIIERGTAYGEKESLTCVTFACSCGYKTGLAIILDENSADMDLMCEDCKTMYGPNDYEVNTNLAYKRIVKR